MQLHAKPPPISVQNPPWPQGLGLQGSLSATKKDECKIYIFIQTYTTSLEYLMTYLRSSLQRGESEKAQL